MFSLINKWLDGKKTIMAGIAATLNALHQIVLDLSDGFTSSDFETILTQITVVLSIFGLGHKVEKAIAFLKK